MAALALQSGCGTSSAPASAHGRAARRAQQAAIVAVDSSSLGRILVDGNGRTLYIFGSDAPGRSTCDGACARVWPPATTPPTTSPTTGPGVAKRLLGVVRRADGAVQLQYAGHPLYTFSGDTRPDQLGGEGFLGEWFAISPNGRPMRRPGTQGSAKGY